MQTPCKHVFDSYCLREWLETSFKCPMCNTRLCTPPVTAGDLPYSIESIDLSLDVDQLALVLAI